MPSTTHPSLYIFWFLHQTTTVFWLTYDFCSCISFDSYIKPQLQINILLDNPSCISFDSYIKPQPEQIRFERSISCISFDSYIKPQLWAIALRLPPVVYLLIPTSNHNSGCWTIPTAWVVYLLIPTSNHNVTEDAPVQFRVVYLLIPTSNHNPWFTRNLGFTLYIFWFLHQTTTASLIVPDISSCISFDSYIKPQLFQQTINNKTVVYLLIPTSNHNVETFHTILARVVYLLIPTSNHNL